jgi:hypothetical protein
MLITITNNKKPNGRPTSIGYNSVTVQNNVTHVFTLDNFTTETTPPYSDPENDPLSYVKIKTISSDQGKFKLNGVDVNVNDTISSGNISSGNFTYVQDTPNSGDANNDFFSFDIADSGSNSLSGLSIGYFTVYILEKENEPASSVGDNTLSTPYATTITFSKADFTSGTTPAYADPEGDAASQLKILSLPLSGLLKYNNTDVSVNQVISFNEIASGYFQYVPDVVEIGLQQESFNFAIADAGSGIFVE